MSELSLTGKIALVTGASRGIGQAIAYALGQQGAIVIGTATSTQGAENISRYLEQNKIVGYGALLNVTDPESIATCLENIRLNFKDNAVGILVNNAGITRDGLFVRMKEQDWDEIIDTNLTGIFRLSKACMREMMKSRWGRIISIGSVVGLTGNPGQVNYCAAKAGVLGFSKALAREVASRGITVNVVAPGFIDTDMTSVLSDDQKEAILKSIPMGYMGQAEDIAASVAFLASDQARYLTGQTLNVNGGMYMS